MELHTLSSIFLQRSVKTDWLWLDDMVTYWLETSDLNTDVLTGELREDGKVVASDFTQSLRNKYLKIWMKNTKILFLTFSISNYLLQ